MKIMMDTGSSGIDVASDNGVIGTSVTGAIAIKRVSGIGGPIGKRPGKGGVTGAIAVRRVTIACAIPVAVTRIAIAGAIPVAAPTAGAIVTGSGSDRAVGSCTSNGVIAEIGTDAIGAAHRTAMNAGNAHWRQGMS